MSPPLALDARPRTEVACNALVQTDNKLFNKVIIVFTYLCEEASTMREHARDNLIPAILLLAEQPTTIAAAAEAAAAAGSTADPVRPEAEAAAALPLLLSVQQFVTRANSVVMNLVHQLASLYTAQQRLFAATFRAVTMRRAFDALCDLFGTLILLDDAVQRLIHLPDALAAYRRVVANMQLEPDRYRRMHVYAYA